MTSRKRCLLIVFLLAGGLILPFFTRIETEEERMIIVYEENDVQTPAYTASLFGIDLSDTVEVSEDIDLTKCGQYTVTYTSRALGITLAQKRIIAVVADIDSPEINLPNGNIVFTRVNEDISFPAYTVRDNCDPAEFLDVHLDDDTDTSSPGIFDSYITACDLSGNCSMKSLKVNVGEIAEEDFTPGVFDLFAYDTEGVILRREGTKLTNREYDRLYFIGDSNYLIMGQYEGGLNPKRVLARYALSPGSFAYPVYYDNREMMRNAPQLVRDLKPKAVVLNMGLSECGNGDPLFLAEMYGECLDSLREVDPNLQIFVSAVLPVTEESPEAAASQVQINRTNYCLLRMCEEKKVPMIYPSEVFLGEDGYGEPGHYQPDGYHIQGGDFPLYVEYIRETVKPEGRG